jgi:chitin disaccharide deacetylase
MLRVLVVNGDDFGLTPGINAGILDAHSRGVLTSASIFATAEASDDAFAIARRTPTLGVGCHLALVDGTPVCPSSTLPTLAPDGAFRQTWASFVAAAIAGRIALAEIERELTAQIDRIRSAGITPTHLDGHKHVHAYPPVFDIVARLAQRFGIRAVRVPWERPAMRLLVRHALDAQPRRQVIENLALTPWALRDLRRLRASGLPPPPRFFGRALTGLFTPISFHALMDALPPGTSELMMHPGYPDASLDRARTRLRAERAKEVSLLTSPAAVATIARAGVRLARHDGISSFPESHSHGS